MLEDIWKFYAYNTTMPFHAMDLCMSRFQYQESGNQNPADTKEHLSLILNNHFRVGL